MYNSKIILTVLLFSFSFFYLSAKQNTSDSKEPGLDAMLGLHYSSWNFEDNTYNISHSAKPYLLKTAEIEFKNFYGFDSKLNYITNNILKNNGFSSPETYEDKDEDGIRRFRFVLETEKTDKTSLGLFADFKKFQGSSLYKEAPDARDTTVHQLNYFSYNGNRSKIDEGKSISWQTTIQDYSFFHCWNSGLQDKYYKLGIFYRTKQSINGISLTPDVANTTTKINGIMDLKQTIVSVYYAQGLEKAFPNWSFVLDTNFGMGLSSYENAFLKIPLVSGSAMSASANVFVKRKIKNSTLKGFIAIGIKGSVVMYSTFGEGGTAVTIEKEISYELPTVAGGGIANAEKGSNWKLETGRYETIWGPYLEAQMSF